MSDKIIDELTEADFRDIASRLPTYPPISARRKKDYTVKDHCPQLSDAELESVFKVYRDEFEGEMEMK